ncbi:MAG TPA: hypothetical protein VF662_13725 [Allosphingosinicella sp.]
MVDAAFRFLRDVIGCAGVSIPIPASLELREPYFVPEAERALSYSARQSFSRNGDQLIVERNAAGAAPALLNGVLSIGDPRGGSAGGDWTRGDAAIGRFFEKHGRTGVPLYLYYAPGKEVQILPQVLTTGRLVSLVA